MSTGIQLMIPLITSRCEFLRFCDLEAKAKAARSQRDFARQVIAGSAAPGKVVGEGIWMHAVAAESELGVAWKTNDL
jgi:hypothetical protein